MGKNNSVSAENRMFLYVNEDHCIRCDSRSKQREHLCGGCVEYLEENVGEEIKYFNVQPVSNYGRSSDIV